MGKLLKGIVTLAAAVALLAGGVYWYVQPQQTLDLAYTDLSVRNKIIDILASRKLEVDLTEAEVNSLLKKALLQHVPKRNGFEITGAQFTLQGDQWVADVNLLYQQQLKIGATLLFSVSWQDPYVTAVHTGTRVRQTGLPLEWFQLKPVQVQLNEYIPKPAGIKNITFLDHAVKLNLGLKLR